MCCIRAASVCVTGVLSSSRRASSACVGVALWCSRRQVTRARMKSGVNSGCPSSHVTSSSIQPRQGHCPKWSHSTKCTRQCLLEGCCQEHAGKGVVVIAVLRTITGAVSSCHVQRLCIQDTLTAQMQQSSSHSRGKHRCRQQHTLRDSPWMPRTVEPTAQISMGVLAELASRVAPGGISKI